MASALGKRKGIPVYTNPTTGLWRHDPSRGASILWGWVWIMAAALVLWWALWGWSGSGGWLGKHDYHTGTNGGRVSERLGQHTDDPAEVSKDSIDAAGNPASDSADTNDDTQADY